MARLVADRDAESVFEIYSGKHDKTPVVVIIAGPFSAVLTLSEVNAVIDALVWARDMAQDDDPNKTVNLTGIETN